VLEVRLLARAPRGLGGDVGVGAGEHEAGDHGAEAAADGGEGLLAALVLDRVVQQRGDGLVLVGSVLEDEGGDGEEVGDVGGGGALAELGGVEAGGVDEGLLEAGGEHRRSVTRGGHAPEQPERRMRNHTIPATGGVPIRLPSRRRHY